MTYKTEKRIINTPTTTVGRRIAIFPATALRLDLKQVAAPSAMQIKIAAAKRANTFVPGCYLMTAHAVSQLVTETTKQQLWLARSLRPTAAKPKATGSPNRV